MKNSYMVGLRRTISCAVLFALLAGGLLLSAPAVYAAGEPSLVVPTTTAHIDAAATTFVVPIAFEDGSPDDQISSVNFKLDYDQACVRINNPSTDITGVQTDFLSSFSNDADAGTLQASIWRPNAQVPLTSGTLLSITFTLEPACRHGISSDPVINFNFVAPVPTFGTVQGGTLSGTAANGEYTLNVNQAPGNIDLSSLAMSESNTGDRQIGVFSATDVDTDPVDTLTLALSGGCTAPFNNQGFWLDTESSTKLRTDRVFDFETEDEYPICMQVTDGQGGLYLEKFTLTVLDANDTPTDIGLSRNIVTQTAAIGDVVGNLSVTDSDRPTQTFTYALVGGEGATDNNSFTIDGTALKIITSTINYATQPEYKVRVQVTDNGDPARSFQKQFRLVVAGISSMALTGEPELPVVLAGETITLPVAFTPSGNNVLTTTFQITYSEACLDYAGLTGVQSGLTANGSDGDGAVDVTMSGSAPMAPGAPVSLVFTGTVCAPASAWTTVGFAAAPAMLGAGDVAFPTAKTDGKLVVLAKSPLGDCNNDGGVNAGDFSATALELFDIEDRTGSNVPAESWLWTPRGSKAFSARGCDSNADRTLLVADLTCTIRRSFGGDCLTGMSLAGAAQPAVVSAPAQTTVAGRGASVPLALQTNGHDVAAFAASLSFDAAMLKLDPTDADGDGLPDAVHFQLPAGMFRMASYDAAAGRIDLVATGLVMPLPTLSDGVIVTLDLTPMAGAVGAPVAVTLGNLSLGDSDGGVVPVVADVTDAPAAGSRLFLPAIVR